MTRKRNRRYSGLPSVTQITSSCGDKSGIIYAAWKCGTFGIYFRDEWDDSADIGTISHAIITDDLASNSVSNLAALDWYGDDHQVSSIRRCHAAWHEWKSTVSIEPIAIEVPLMSDECGFGGTPDVVAYVDGELSIIDVKTTDKLSIYDSHLLQLAAYGILWSRINGERIERYHIVVLSRTSGEYLHRSWSDEELDPARSAFRHAWRVHHDMKCVKKLIRATKTPTQKQNRQTQNRQG